METLAAAPDLLLGAATPERHDHARVISAGNRLVLFTDGLVEHRSRTADEGVDELREVIAANADAAPIEVCAALVEALVHGRQEDDVAVMVMALDPAPSSDLTASH